MIINCVNCKIEMKEAWLNTGAGAFQLQQKTKKVKFFSTKTCPVSVYVCTTCGRVQLIAEKPEIFNDDILEK